MQASLGKSRNKWCSFLPNSGICYSKVLQNHRRQPIGKYLLIQWSLNNPGPTRHSWESSGLCSLLVGDLRLVRAGISWMRAGSHFLTSIALCLKLAHEYVMSTVMTLNLHWCCGGGWRHWLPLGPARVFCAWPAKGGSLWLFCGEGLGDQVCFYLFFSVSTVLSVAELSQKLARTQNMSSLLSPLSVCFTKCSINIIHTLPSRSPQTANNTSDSSERSLNFDWLPVPKHSTPNAFHVCVLLHLYS